MTRMSVRPFTLYTILSLTVILGSRRPGIVLFSVPRNGNQGLKNAIVRPRRTENKKLCSLFSVPGDGKLA